MTLMSGTKQGATLEITLISFSIVGLLSRLNMVDKFSLKSLEHHQ